MQQYFSDHPLAIGDIYVFSKEQAHHAHTVLHLSHETIRLVYENTGYFAQAYPEGKLFCAKVLAVDPCTNELPIKITLCLALIRREKMELALQKATELGVLNIVLFESSRCVVHAKKEKLERYQSIVQQASAQCKRTLIPSITGPLPFAELSQFKSACNIIPYEGAAGNGMPLLKAVHGSSVTAVIGPEGGFSKAEAEDLMAKGFQPVSLGKRILRAETACFYVCSVLGAWSEGK